MENDIKGFQLWRKYHLIPCTILFLLICTLSFSHAADRKHLNSFEEELLRCVNQYRVKNDLKPLSFDRTLNNLAKNHCRYMSKTGEMNHDNFDERFRQCGRMLCVENIGWNSPTPEAQFEAWKNSKGHNANLLNREIKHAGISKVGPYVTFFACD